MAPPSQELEPPGKPGAVQYHIPPHTHPNPEVVTILSGTLHLGEGAIADQSKANPLPAGSFFVMSPGMQHYVYADEETVLQLNSNGPWGLTYVNEKDDPRKNDSQILTEVVVGRDRSCHGDLPDRVPALTGMRTFASWCEGDRGPSARAHGVCLTAPFWLQIVPYNKRVIHCRSGGLTMHTIILAIVIALAGLVMIASGALQLSMLEAAEGEMLQMSDYLSEIGTLASGLGMLGLAEVLRLLLRITA